jgi:class 3 adenylate cyclase
MVTDTSWRVLSINRSFALFLDVDARAAAGKPAAGLVKRLPALASAFSAGVEVRQEIATGDTFHDMSITRVVDPRGRFGGWLVHLRDITERVRAVQTMLREKEKSEVLLLNIFPGPIAQRLKDGGLPISDSFAEATILFVDIVDFTPFCETLTPGELVETLDALFSLFDGLAERYGVEKIKTVGDAWMAACGVPVANRDHAGTMALLALAIVQAVAGYNKGAQRPLEVRIGMHCGPVVAGVIGLKRFIYDLWGDTVNTACRMESGSLPNRIQVTEAIHDRLKDRHIFEERGEMQVKGKGTMKTWFLVG